MKKTLLILLLSANCIALPAKHHNHYHRSKPSLLKTIASLIPLTVGLYLFSNPKKISIIPLRGKPYTYTQYSKLGLLLMIIGAYTSYTTINQWADSDCCSDQE